MVVSGVMYGAAPNEVFGFGRRFLWMGLGLGRSSSVRAGVWASGRGAEVVFEGG